jgi:hypothetical protein
VTVQAVNPVVSAAAFATRRGACQLMMTQRHEQPAADGRALLKEAGDIMVYLGGSRHRQTSPGAGMTI